MAECLESTKLYDQSVFKENINRVQDNSLTMGIRQFKSSLDKKIFNPSLFKTVTKYDIKTNIYLHIIIKKSPILGYYQPTYKLVQK